MFTGMDGPTCTFWANLTPFWVQVVREMEQMVQTLEPTADRDVHSAFKEACNKAFGMS